MHLTALLACHDRRELTLRCLRSLFAVAPDGVRLDAVLVDDGSSDGTADAVAALGLPVTIVRGDGSWFWSRSLAETERVAETHDPDAVLWLNDDVRLDPGALMLLVAGHDAHPDSILVGPLRTERSGRTVYGGWRLEGGRVFGTRLEPADGAYRPVDVFHGNLVLVPRSARRRIGPVDGTWAHQFADLDDALRAVDAGVSAFQLPLSVGTCQPVLSVWDDPRRTRWQRVRMVVGRRAWPLRSTTRFWWRHRRHVGAAGVLTPYRRSWSPPELTEEELAAVEAAESGSPSGDAPAQDGNGASMVSPVCWVSTVKVETPDAASANPDSWTSRGARQTRRSGSSDEPTGTPAETRHPQRDGGVRRRLRCRCPSGSAPTPGHPDA